MAHLHANNIVHRDLALRNVLAGDALEVNREFNVVVADFGLSRLMEQTNTDVGVTKASFAVEWSAPETLMSREYSKDTDTWSFGILIWELFNRASRVPWTKIIRVRTEVMLLEAIKSKKRPALPAQVPKQMQAIINECWTYEPQNRPRMSNIKTRIATLLKEYESGELCPS